MINRSELKTKAKQALNNNWGIAIGSLLLFDILLGASAGIGLFVGELILMGVFMFGLIGIYLNIIRTNKAEIETLFSGFSNFGTTCLAGVLTWLYTMLWTLLFIIPGIIKSFSYSMTFYILNDNPTMSADDAITASRKMMDGHKWDLFVLYLSFIGWWILSSFTFGLLYILYVGPYMQATTACFYEKIKGEPQVQ